MKESCDIANSTLCEAFIDIEIKGNMQIMNQVKIILFSAVFTPYAGTRGLSKRADLQCGQCTGRGE
jgi:hypothetical protein